MVFLWDLQNRGVVQPADRAWHLFSKIDFKGQEKKDRDTPFVVTYFLSVTKSEFFFELLRAADHYNLEFALYHCICRLFVHFQVRIYLWQQQQLKRSSESFVIN